MLRRLFRGRLAGDDFAGIQRGLDGEYDFAAMLLFRRGDPVTDRQHGGLGKEGSNTPLARKEMFDQTQHGQFEKFTAGGLEICPSFSTEKLGFV